MRDPNYPRILIEEEEEEKNKDIEQQQEEDEFSEPSDELSEE